MGWLSFSPRITSNLVLRDKDTKKSHTALPLSDDSADRSYKGWQ